MKYLFYSLNIASICISFFIITYLLYMYIRGKKKEYLFVSIFVLFLMIISFGYSFIYIANLLENESVVTAFNTLFQILSISIIYIAPLTLEALIKDSNKNALIWLILAIVSFIIYFILKILRIEALNFSYIVQFATLIWVSYRSIHQLKGKNIKYSLLWAISIFNIITFIFFPIKFFIDFPIIREQVFPNLPLWFRTAPIHFLIADVFILISIVKEVKSKKNESLKNILEIVETFGLSAREKDILFLIVRGDTYSIISKSLSISTSTVKAHIQNIYRKTKSSNRGELMSLVNSNYYNV